MFKFLFKRKRKKSKLQLLKNSLKNLPGKYYNPLMVEMVIQCKKSGHFKNNDIARFVKLIEVELLKK